MRRSPPIPSTNGIMVRDSHQREFCNTIPSRADIITPPRHVRKAQIAEVGGILFDHLAAVRQQRWGIPIPSAFAVFRLISN
jgi:hypothetical protein